MKPGRRPDPSAARGGELAGARRLVLEGLAAAAVSVLGAVWVLRLWRGDLALPLRYTPVDDTKFYLALVKGIAEHGSYAANANLGAPFGQRLIDYPQGADSLNLLIIRLFALLSANPALLINLFFLASFALAGFTAHLVLRAQGIGALPAGVAAVLFALLAYHFFRGESHLFLSAYYGVPLAAHLFMRVIGGEPLFVRRPAAAGGRAGRFAWASRRSLASLAICLVIGSDNLYYATFAVVMLAGGALIALCARRPRAAAGGVLALVLVCATVGANLAPSLLYRARHGTNLALERSFAANESSNEAFGLQPANLLLPAPDARIGPLREVTERYDHAIAPGYCEACYSSLGTVGDAGFIWLTLGGLVALAGLGGALASRRLLRGAAAGAWLAIAVGTVGGLSGLIELVFTPDVRAWNRISVLIAFFSLLAVAVGLEALGARLARRRHGRGAWLGLLALVLVFGVWDQSSDSYIPPYRATARQWNSDGRLVAQIEARLPAGAAVFQLPYVPYPEGYPETPVGGLLATYSTKYEPLRGYLHSRQLRWSYGQVKGLPGDWQAELAGQPLPYVLAAAVAAGFEGLWVDPAGFEPAVVPALHANLRSLLEEEGLISPDGDLWFFDLRGYAARLRRAHSASELALLRRRTLHPLRAECVAGGLALTNPGRSSVAATLAVRLAHAQQAPETAPTVYPDGRVSEPAGTAPVTLERRISLTPGRTVIPDPRANGPAGPDTQVLYASLTDETLRTFARAPTGSSSTIVAGLTGPPCAT